MHHTVGGKTLKQTAIIIPQSGGVGNADFQRFGAPYLIGVRHMMAVIESRLAKKDFLSRIRIVWLQLRWSRRKIL
jgi:hypothetical protein